MRAASGVATVPRARERRPPRRPTALLARLCATRLDRDLAAGVAPWRSPRHAARSLQLTSARSRRSLARALELLVVRAGMTRREFVGTAVVPPCRAQVREAAPLILALAARLRGGEPVRTRGVATLRLLLCDGTGPCYKSGEPGTLSAALEAVARSLDTLE